MNSFEAGVQYNDFKGTVAADLSDTVSFFKHLKEKGLIKATEKPVGYGFNIGENHGHRIRQIEVKVWALDDPAKKIRAITLSMEIDEFFSHFKRFDLNLMHKDINLDGIEVDGSHYD